MPRNEHYQESPWLMWLAYAALIIAQMISTVSLALLTSCDRNTAAPDKNPAPGVSERGETRPSAPTPPPVLPDTGDRSAVTDVESAVAAIAEAEATLQGDDHLSGTVYLHTERGGVAAIAVIEGLPPGQHAIHVHETGDCSADDFTSAGGHLNPGGTSHGAPFAENKHLGDMGNLTTNERGDAFFGYMLTSATLDPDEANTLIDKAVIIHKGMDDLTSQPSGAAGDRIACGVIQAR